MSTIAFRGVTKTFPRGTGLFQAIGGVDLEVGDKEFISVVGPSGCGKTTLMRMVAGLEVPTEGEVLVDGKPVTGPGADRAVVFQQFALFPWKTVYENIVFGMRSKGASKAEQDAAVAHYLKLMKMEGTEASYPHQLSGGMQQRVAIARSYALDPGVLLMDEPFGALDEIVRDHLNEQLLGLWDKTGKTVVFVTHSIPEAVFLSNRIVVMSPRPGRIIDVIETDFPRDRTLDIRETPEFLEVAHRVREGLRQGHSYDD